MGLPSTYQQVLKNMEQIRDDHALLTDETNGLQAIADKVNDEQTGIDALADKVDLARTDINAINNRLSDTDNKRSYEQNVETLERIESDVYNEETGLNALRDKVGELEDIVTDEDTGVVGLRDKVEEMETKVDMIDNLNSIVTNNDTGVNALNTKVNNLTGRVTTLEGKVSTVEGKLPDYDNGLTDITQLKATVYDGTIGNQALKDKIDSITTGGSSAAAAHTRLDIYDKIIQLPEHTKIDDRTSEPTYGKLIYTYANGQPMPDPETGHAKLVDIPDLAYLEVAEVAEQLKTMFIPQGGEDNKSSVVSNSSDETKVIGLHINTVNVNINSTPASYKQGVTFEIKQIATIGLNGKAGMSGTYCLVATFTKDTALDNEGSSSSITTFKPFQIAYATDNATYYKRFANSTSATSWNAWISGTRSMEEMAIVAAAKSDNPDLPDYNGTQLTGEYWYETLS